MYDLIVIGAGASGLAAAISASRQGCSVLVLERGARAGKKLSASGNGRGNISNRNIASQFYHSSSGMPDLKQSHIVFDFFKSLGLTLREEEGRLYPYSFKATAVTDCLLCECKRLGVELIYNAQARSAAKTGDGFVVDFVGGRASSKTLVLATGGSAGGGFDDGYTLLGQFGHDITPNILPSLVQLKADMSRLKGLKGVKSEVCITLEGEHPQTSCGDLLFTDYGISGNAVFAISGYVVRQLFGKKSLDILVDFMPDLSLGEAISAVAAVRGNEENPLLGLFHKNIARCILMQAGADSVSENTAPRIARTAKGFKITVGGSLGLANAQVTAGGAVLTQFDGQFMSRLTDGLFCTGELLDVDGDCGGYNLHFAFLSGLIAGGAVAQLCR